MRASTISIALLASAASNVSAYVLAGAKGANRLWGELSVYEDNDEDAFGVDYVGLPDGCQVVSGFRQQLIDKSSYQPITLLLPDRSL